jgi:dTDP-glucose pyrophosphorylase
MTFEAIILAGGFGTRLREAVPDLPKPMAPIAGRPFLAWQLDYLIATGIQHVIFSVGYKAESISNYFGSSYAGCSISYVREDEPLGTGGPWGLGGLYVLRWLLLRRSAFLFAMVTLYAAQILRPYAHVAAQAKML